jgi:hypothetical protein
MIEREIVLIGLGRFGKKVNADFTTLLADRRSLLPPAEQERIGVFQVDIACDSPFDFEAYHNLIESVTRNSFSRNNNRPFDFYFVGDLGEIGVALQAIDIAYLLRVMNKSGILRIEDDERPGSIVSFFTYSDLIGSTSAYSKDQVSSFVWFLERSAEIARSRSYQPGFSGPNGKSFPPIAAQPFDRNYLSQTPGDEETIMSQSARVFCERLFIELMILEPEYKRNIRKTQRNLSDAEAPFCSFSFYQVPRLADLQRYMLKFRFEEFCLDLAKGKPLLPSQEKSLREKFRRLFDLEPGKEGAFPSDRIAGIFLRRNSRDLKKAIVPYVGGGDVQDYVAKCTENARTATAKLDDALQRLLREEFVSMKASFIEGTRVLFQVPALYGYFAHYIDFLEEIRGYIRSWAQTDFAADAEKDRAAFTKALEDGKKKLAELDAAKILQFPLFAPLKKELAERIIASLPYDLLIAAGISEKLGEYLKTDYLDPKLNSDHPLHVLDELIGSLSGFIEKISSRQAYVQEKLKLIDGMLDYYYVKSYVSASDNHKTMERVAFKYFSETRKHDLRNRYQKEIYNFWKQNLSASAEFLHQDEDFVREIQRNADKMLKSQEITSLLEIDRNASAKFFSALGDDIHLSLDRLAERSFRRVQSHIGREDELIVVPKSEDRDDFAVAIAAMCESARSSEAEEWDRALPIEREFTVGSALFLRERLFMPIDTLVKWEQLKDYAKSDIKSREASLYQAKPSRGGEAPHGPASATAAPSGAQGAAAEPLTRRQKAVRMIIKDYMSGDRVLELYGQYVGARAGSVTDEVIEELARKAVSSELLPLLNDDDLRRVSREFDVIAGIQRARTIKNIEHYLDSL